MIINLNLESKKIIIIGGGKEAQKRINSLLKEKCEILVISDSANLTIKKLIKTKKIKFFKQKITDTKFIFRFKPDIIITTTNDASLNQKILDTAKKGKIIAYSADNPKESDFSNPSVINLENVIQIAIFTGGRSPTMSKKIRIQLEKILWKIITEEDIAQIKIQEIARISAKRKIETQKNRREFLKDIMMDKEIKQLIKEGKLKKAENRVNNILKEWK